MSERDEEMQGGEFDVAIIGMSGRFPGADTLEEFWANLRGGADSITRFTVEELEAAGVPRAHLDNPDYVRAIGKLRDVQHFDAAFFGYSPREAETLEPAHRLFLECAWEALEDAGYDPARVEGTVGVYAGAGTPSYAENNVRPNAELMASTGHMQVNLGSGKDFIATRTAYKLDLRGPALTVQTACSTALVSVHLAAQSLLRGECDMALAGGATVNVPQDTGYMWAHGGIASKDGYCRSFDAKSGGTVASSGVGVVLLKRMEDALRDGDPVRAVIRGSAINNDGAAKVAFTAPGVEGQSAVIGEALATADVDPETVTYVETHGSGTDLGDTIEIAALTRAYKQVTDRTGFCALGAVKAAIGHTDAAAGAAGLIKTVLALEAKEIPPTPNFEAPNERLDFTDSPFFVSSKLTPWETPDGVPRRAGVSSFGIGGTNAHVIVEEAPEPNPSGPSRPWQVLTLSARSPKAVDAAAERLAAHLEKHPELPLADVAFTLQEGRRAFSHRRSIVVREGENVGEIVRGKLPERVANGAADAASRSVVFLFSGLGDHYPNMARGLYEAEPVFRAEVDRCAEILRGRTGLDVREVIFPGAAPSDAPPATGGFDLRRMLAQQEVTPEAERLNRTELAQPAVFVIDYALAKLWMSWGIVPEAVIGHSLGEYAAACIAGILTLEDALALVADRARMIQELPGGAMLAVSADPEKVRPFLSPDLAIATVNAPNLCVVAGPDASMSDLEKKLADGGLTARRLATTHAFHSPMMEPIAEKLAARAGQLRLRPAKIPMITNVTGTWITEAEATDPRHWVRHLLGTVRFAEGMGELLKEPGRVLLEVGPGQTLSTFVRQRPSGGDGADPIAVIPSVRYAYDRKPDQAFLLEALGRLWLAGVSADWKAFRGDEDRRRVRLPTYPWEKQRYWVEPPSREAAPALAFRFGKQADPAQWTYLPTWERTAAPAAAAKGERVLVFSDGGALAEGVAERLSLAHGCEVHVVRAGDRFDRQMRFATVRPAEREDFQALARELGEESWPAHVVFAWREPSALLMAAEAFGHHGKPANLTVLTRGAQEVTGDEEIDLAAAASLGATRVIGQEYPSLACRAVDVSGDDATVTARAAAEVLAKEEAPLVALRGRHRWVRHFRPERPAQPAAKVESAKTYLVAGGLESRGGALARALARTLGVRMVIVDRQVAEPGGAALIADLETAGAVVLSVAADPADRAALEGAVRQGEARFGALAGVLWSTPLETVAGLAAIAEAGPEWDADVAAVGAALEALESALGDRALEFVLLESSLAGVLGTPGRVRVSMAHALVDAFAQRHNRGGRAVWTSVDWDRWRPVPDHSPDELWIEADELPAALKRALALAGEPQVLVSTADVEERIRRAAAPAAKPATGTALYERPELASTYAEPTNEVEERLAELWQNLLGIKPIGIHDDFFGLGGHSLFATQIISRVREIFQIDLPLAAIFEAPTIEKFAALIEEAIFAEIEAMSDEEALSLVGEE